MLDSNLTSVQVNHLVTVVEHAISTSKYPHLLKLLVLLHAVALLVEADKVAEGTVQIMSGFRLGTDHNLLRCKHIVLSAKADVRQVYCFQVG